MKTPTFYMFLLLLISTGLAGTITINISGITHNDGFLRVVLFDKAEGFPSSSSFGIRDTSIAKPNGSETVTFANIPAGTYAMSVLHDRNVNKKNGLGNVRFAQRSVRSYQ